MRVRLEDVCEKGSSKLKQSDVIDQNGLYPVYGASGYLGNVNTYQQSNYYVAVVKDGAGIGRTMLLPPKSSIIGTMQYLIPKDNVLPEYLYYVVKAKHLEKYFSGATIPHIYFKDYKNEQFDLVSFEEQREIINRIKKIEIIIDDLSKTLALLDELVRARFVEMFGNPRINPMNFNKSELKDTCDIITGNTPSRKNEEYYGNYIEWIKTDNIVVNKLNPTYAKESLSKEGMDVGRTVDKNCILMACIAGSISSIGRVCVTDRKVAFNQQINAIVPKKYNCMFLYVLMQVSKDYLVDGINMALKGILSKSRLEEKQFIVPPLELQNQFASFVQEIDKSRSRIEKSLEASQELFDSLMQEYFG
mgnify:CR=1 FL=1